MAMKVATRNELVPMSAGGFLSETGPVVITERSFAFGEGATEDTAMEAARGLRRFRGIGWLLGDMLIASEDRFADIYSQLEHETGYGYQTLANAKSLCKRFPAALRLWDLTPSFYEIVASLDDASVKKYLDMAASKGFERDDFRDYVREEKAEAAKKANKAAGVGTGDNSDGAAGIGTGKPAPIKVEASPKSLAVVALEHFTQEERGELASLVLANTTADQTNVKAYDLAIADQFPVGMLMFAIERRVASFDQDEAFAKGSGPALLKALKQTGKLAEKWETEDDWTSGKSKPAAKAAGKPAGKPIQPAAGKDTGKATPAPKPAGKGKGKGKPADPAPAPVDGGDDLPVRDIDETAAGDAEYDTKEGDADADALEVGADPDAPLVSLLEGVEQAANGGRNYKEATGADLSLWASTGDELAAAALANLGGAEVFMDSDKAEMGITEGETEGDELPGFPPGYVADDPAPELPGEGS